MARIRSNRTRAPSPEPSASHSSDLVKVVFIKTHTHSGKEYKKGDEDSFPLNTVERMLALQAVELDNS